MNLESLAIRYSKSTGLEVLDQTLLPFSERWLSVNEVDSMKNAIQQLSVRGAPLIGVAAALCLGQMALDGATTSQLLKAAESLRSSRPTAVNLMWAIDAMKQVIQETKSPSAIWDRALKWYQEDQELCEQMAIHGLQFIPESGRVLTHCNTGGLATAGIGTALGVFAKAHQSGRALHVYVDETRPLLQGARLTAYELKKLGIEYTLICDHMSAGLMAQGQVDAVFVGADRIAKNGDFANKIGTYSLAILARYHHIPFYVVAPETTRDPNCNSGAEIPIEMRKPEEVRGYAGLSQCSWAEDSTPVYNPAFDVTPAHLVTAWIYDSGVVASHAVNE